MTSLRSVILAGLLLVVLSACAGLPPVPEYAPRLVRSLQTFELWVDGRQVGAVTQLQIEDPSAPPPFFQVTNTHGQWLGHVDHQGRVYQRVPFSFDDVFRGVHPLTEGIGLLVGARGPVAIRTPRDAGVAPREAALRVSLTP